MTVNLNYFKMSGKWYAEGSYETECEHLFQIWDEVVTLKTLPGLMPISKPASFIISVDVPDHKDRHPHLIIPWG